MVQPYVSQLKREAGKPGSGRSQVERKRCRQQCWELRERLRAIHPTPHPFSRAGGLGLLQAGFGQDPTPFLLEGLEEFEQMLSKAGEAIRAGCFLHISRVFGGLR
jgi:hypothetical protein